jgi:hypothetical protein
MWWMKSSLGRALPFDQSKMKPIWLENGNYGQNGWSKDPANDDNQRRWNIGLDHVEANSPSKVQIGHQTTESICEKSNIWFPAPQIHNQFWRIYP